MAGRREAIIDLSVSPDSLKLRTSRQGTGQELLSERIGGAQLSTITRRLESSGTLQLRGHSRGHGRGR